MLGYLKKAMIWIQSQHHYKHKGNVKEQKLRQHELRELDQL